MGCFYHMKYERIVFFLLVTKMFDPTLILCEVTSSRTLSFSHGSPMIFGSIQICTGNFNNKKILFLISNRVKNPEFIKISSEYVSLMHIVQNIIF